MSKYAQGYFGNKSLEKFTHGISKAQDVSGEISDKREFILELKKEECFNASLDFLNKMLGRSIDPESHLNEVSDNDVYSHNMSIVNVAVNDFILDFNLKVRYRFWLNHDEDYLYFNFSFKQRSNHDNIGCVKFNNLADEISYTVSKVIDVKPQKDGMLLYSTRFISPTTEDNFSKYMMDIDATGYMKYIYPLIRAIQSI